MNENLLNITVTTAELAEHFGVSEKYLSELHREQGLPKTGHDAWPLIACDKWRFNYITKNYEARLEKAFSDKSADVLARKNAEYRDILIKEKQKQLLDRTEVFNALSELLNIIINSLDGFGLNTAPSVVGINDVAVMAEKLNEPIQQIKKQIAESKLNIDLPEEFS